MKRTAPRSRTFLWPAAVVSILCALLLPVAVLDAHPIARRTHDRTISVRLTPDGNSGKVLVTVEYCLDVDEATVVFDDLPAVNNKVELTKLRTPDDFYQAFMRAYAPILAANLVAELDGQALAFDCTKQGHRLTDEKGVPLNHLRCDFVFQARKTVAEAREHHDFSFREGNYELEEGQIRLAFSHEPSLRLLSKTEPEKYLQERPPAELRPGDDTRLRRLGATFSLIGSAATKAPAAAAPSTMPNTENQRTESPPAATPAPGESAQGATPVNTQRWWQWLKDLSLRDLFRETRYGFWMLMLLALAVGGVHALTPGHGKTLVAAYLVGERGTMGHAFLLGLVTTLTHTGVVIAIALGLRLFIPDGRLTAAGQQSLQTVLELGGGLLVVGLGFWLLLRRLTGQADHFHLPGHGHHHHHEHNHDHHHGAADHYHDEHGHVHKLPAGQSVSWWGLIVLGINGGIVPCWDAIVVLLLAVSTNRLWLALPLLLAFSAGLAGVLILVGIVVVRAKRLADPRWEGSRFFRLLPIASALMVTVLGLWLCYDSLHPQAAPPVDVVQMQ